MSLRDLLKWMWEEDGTWYVQGFQNAWSILAARQAAEGKGQPTDGRREDGHPPTREPAPPPPGSPAWRGGPCDPLCEFEDDGLLLIGG